MYSVSEAYIEQMMHRGTRRRLSGTIGSMAFTGDDVVKNSFSISSRATEESDTKIGGVYLSELEMTFVPSFISKVARDQYRGKEVSVSIGLWIPDEEDLVDGGEWVDVPCGTFTLEAPKISKRGITVSGYDNMSKLDKKFNIDQTTGTVYGYLSYIATECSVTLGQTQADIESLPNGTELLGLYSENDIETYRDLLYWIAQTCGCFACAGRDGKIYLRKFGNPTDVEINENHRDADVVFSGYTTKWTGISVVDMENQMTRYYGLEIDDGLTMNMGSNPLLQIGSIAAINRRCRNILNAVAEIQYTPFYCNSARDPIFDLGDEIEFTGGISGNTTGCVMALNMSLDNYTFEGYGDDPALANARSKTDKNIAGLMQNTVENEITFHQFSNADVITFGSEQEVTLASMRFTAAQETTVKILHEFIFDMVADLASDCSYEIHYYLDNQLLSYKPYERIGGLQSVTSGDTTEGSICRDFFYVIKDVTPSLAHTWEVKMIAHNIDSVTIETNHAHVVLEGQRMYGEDYFDGFIEASDNLTIIPINNLVAIEITDSATINLINAIFVNASDNVTLYNVNGIGVLSMSEGTDELSPHIFFEGGFHIITDDEKYIVTDDGKRLLTD